MGGLPARVWVAADEVCKIINDGIWISSDGPSISWGESRMAVGNAILAERKRCAGVARDHAGWLRLGGPHAFHGAERIAKAIEAGT